MASFVSMGLAQAGESKGTIGVIGMVCMDHLGTQHLWNEGPSFDLCVDQIVRDWELKNSSQLVSDSTGAEAVAADVHELIQGYGQYRRMADEAATRLKR